MPGWSVRFAMIALVAALAFGVVAEAAAAPTAEGSVSGERGGARLDREECRVLDKINDYRRQRGRRPVALDRNLNAAAAHHSEDMAERDYFSHRLKGGKDWDENIRSFGYRSNPIGENIFAGSSKANAAFKAWKESPGHRKTMLDRQFEAIGIGRDSDRRSEYGWYWTTTFGGEVESSVRC